MTAQIGTTAAADVGTLRGLLAAAAPWAPAGAVEERAAALAEAGVPAVRRGGRLVAVLDAERGAARFGSVLAAPDAERDLAHLYAELAEGWVAAGVVTHTMNVPAGAPERIWFDLSFGRQQAYAVAELAAVPAAGPLPPRLEISLVGPEALDEVVGLSDIITRHQALSPVFSRSTDAWLASLRGSIAEELAGGEARCLLARRAGVAVGFTLSFDTGPGLLAPAGAVELSVAAVPPAERGTGIGEALTAAVVADARERGAGHLVADWRTTNLLASRFWPRWGLRPVVYRMVRTIDLTPFA